MQQLSSQVWSSIQWKCQRMLDPVSLRPSLFKLQNYVLPKRCFVINLYCFCFCLANIQVLTFLQMPGRIIPWSPVTRRLAWLLRRRSLFGTLAWVLLIWSTINTFRFTLIPKLPKKSTAVIILTVNSGWILTKLFAMQWPLDDHIDDTLSPKEKEKKKKKRERERETEIKGMFHTLCYALNEINEWTTSYRILDGRSGAS